ncbi:MAG: AraC family transcriptional regulator [Bacteroidetes bacterium]|nr:AraC family transcriptional regulator [Bacteroidota bacterium]MBU1720953.1 AraC family transcriptional regulator [Bacteroidota bacterium]
MPASTASRKEYIARVNRVTDFIDNNIDGCLNLSVLSGIAHFSPFHFHRIFTLLQGETPHDYIRRIRLERAASTLISDTDVQIFEVAVNCGFSGISVLSRQFREHFGVSPTEFRTYWEENSKNSKTLSKDSKPDLKNLPDFWPEKPKTKRRSKMDTHVEVKEMPAMNLLYCRHIGEFELIGSAYEKLFRYAGPRGLLRFPDTKTVSVYHDDPNVTRIEKLRQSACITVDRDVKPDGEFGTLELPAVVCAVGRFEIAETEFSAAWDEMCDWMTNSGYQPGEGLPYELYHNDHEQHPEKKFILDICIPVKPL